MVCESHLFHSMLHILHDSSNIVLSWFVKKLFNFVVHQNQPIKLVKKLLIVVNFMINQIMTHLMNSYRFYLCFNALWTYFIIIIVPLLIINRFKCMLYASIWEFLRVLIQKICWYCWGKFIDALVKFWQSWTVNKLNWECNHC